MNKCLLCDGEINEIYAGQIRAGKFGKKTDESYKVLQCKSCEAAWLDPFPSIDYHDPGYRMEYTGSADSEEYIDMFDHEQTPRINRIGIERFRNKVVADLGCGGGSFLDAIKGVAKKTLAIEPFVGYHESLKMRGHDVYSYTKSLEKESVDIVISFGVIEHTDNPVTYLKDAFSILKKGGKIYLETDNLNDFLMKADIKEFKEFFYRTAHNWYFNNNSLMELFNNVGFNNLKPGFRHGYDLSNTLCWLRDRKPTGLNKIDWISNVCDEVWRDFLEQNEFAELLHFSATK